DVLDEGLYDPVLEETSREAHRAGITGTPSFVFDDRYLAVGAQPVERLRGVLDRALEGREEREAPPGGEERPGAPESVGEEG
ncbi:MAG: DsbA family protein, partial [Longimicrobiales bacterium]